MTVSGDAVNVVWTTASKNTAAVKFIRFVTPCTKSIHIKGAVGVFAEGTRKNLLVF